MPSELLGDEMISWMERWVKPIVGRIGWLERIYWEHDSGSLRLELKRVVSRNVTVLSVAWLRWPEVGPVCCVDRVIGGDGGAVEPRRS